MDKKYQWKEGKIFKNSDFIFDLNLFVSVKVLKLSFLRGTFSLHCYIPCIFIRTNYSSSKQLTELARK